MKLSIFKMQLNTIIEEQKPLTVEVPVETLHAILIFAFLRIQDAATDPKTRSYLLPRAFELNKLIQDCYRINMPQFFE